MKFSTIKNQKGFGFWDIVFWVCLVSSGIWVYHQYLSHPDGLNPRPADHSAYEDKK